MHDCVCCPPGALFQRGPTAVVYVAEDQAGNAAVCSFNVFIAGESTTLPQEFLYNSCRAKGRCNVTFQVASSS